MEAGRKLDALIAEKVMGLIFRKKEGYPKFDDDVPYYSTRIEDAWLVVEKLREMGAWINVSIGTHKMFWECRGIINEGKDNEVRFINHAPTAPLAICLAALKAIE